MVLLVIALGGGLAAGLLRRPIGGHSARSHLRHPELLAAGAVLLVASGPLEGDAAVLAYCFSMAAVACFAGINRHSTGLLVLGVGVVLNLVGLVLNNGLPVRPEALVRADRVEAEELATFEPDAPRHLETDADSLPWLGAIVPVGFAGQVVSFGDLIALVGLVDATRDLARRRSRAPRHLDLGDDGYWEAIGDASADQDWGDAPSGVAVSGSQYSANPDRPTAETMEFWREAEAERSLTRFAARHDR